MLDLRHEPMADHFAKWHIGGLPVAAVLHRISAPDHGPPHDHPWPFTSTIISGGYLEQVFDVATGASRMVERRPGEAFHIEAAHVHRIVALTTGEAWTLVLPGPPERTSGFYEWRDGKPWHRPWHRAEFLPLEESA